MPLSTTGRIWVSLLVLLMAALPLAAQRELSGTARIKLALDRLEVLGTVLMIAAHPDDENTALLAYFARGRSLRTAYLSMTRGEGGQNLIGAERGDLMGVIRTQELLAARRVDGAEQYFTRAIDFGYSKTAEETLAKWGKQEVLSDVVWVIRRLRPDIIVLRFSGASRDGHGHHQSSAILAKEAFRAAADPEQFPEQLRHVSPWQAKRVFWNVFSFRRGNFSNAGDMSDRLDVDAGEFNPVLGLSYAEIAGMSRSMHRSQGFGAPLRKGPSRNSLVLVDGEPAQSDPLEGIDTSWSRVAGGAEVGRTLARANENFNPQQPEKIVPLLLEARGKMTKLSDTRIARKLAELDETIALATGLWLDAAAQRSTVTPGSQLKVEVTALNRSPYPLELVAVELDGAALDTTVTKLADNQPVRKTLEWNVPADQTFSQPYWLREANNGSRYHIAEPTRIGEPDTPPVLTARFRVRAGDLELEYRRPVIHRWVDRVRGELTEPLSVVPAVSAEFVQTAVLFPAAAAKMVEVKVAANAADATGELRLSMPVGWSVKPASQSFALSTAGEQVVLAFEVTPPASAQTAEATAIATVNGTEISSGTHIISYTHIPPQTLSPASRARLVRVDAKTLARRVGYVAGAGDDVPHALRELGCEVTLLESEALVRADLSRYDAIVTGVRAYNTRADLRANQQRLLDYVESGGTLIVQYNVSSRFRRQNGPDPLARLGPYPLKIGRGRVSVEEAPMSFLKPDHPVLQAPNRITEGDFEAWVQERGLYFAGEWDERYEPLWEAHDPGEEPLAGSTLYARHGKGVYIFTGLSWFRQLPAGVPGAYRIFANLLSAGKTIQ